jgi:hypothetical protein
MKTCANDPKFVQHLEQTFLTRDGPMQEKLLKDGLGNFVITIIVQECSNENYMIYDSSKGSVIWAFAAENSTLAMFPPEVRSSRVMTPHLGPGGDAAQLPASPSPMTTRSMRLSKYT